MAFEVMWEDAHRAAWPCCGCCCTELLFTSRSPMIAAKYKLCCCKGAASTGEDFAGNKGCIDSIQKLCCCVSMCSTTNMSCGCCGCNCCQPYGSAGEVEPENDFMENVFWCCYCCVWGCGCSSCNYPCLFNDIKVCCFGQKDTTDWCWTEENGCVAAQYKTCCLMQQLRCPPTLDIGCSLFGYTCCRTEREEYAPSLITES